MTVTQEQRTAPRTPRRALTVALWVLQVVAAAWFLMAALGKFAGAEQIAATFDAIGFGLWFRYLIGALEVAGAVALLVPRLAGLAGLAFVGLMAGAVVTQVVVVGGGVVAPLAALVLSALIAGGRWRTATQLWTSLVRRHNG